MVSSCINPYVCLIDEPWTHINSVDTFMYPYALPILQFPYPFSSLCLSCNLSSSLRSLHKSFRQYILAQFNKSISYKYTSNNMSKDKQVNVFRISLPIPLRPSKSVLAKSKFFKKKSNYRIGQQSRQQALFLSLLPPSCMVALIRELLFSTTNTAIQSSKIA